LGLGQAICYEPLNNSESSRLLSAAEQSYGQGNLRLAETQLGRVLEADPSNLTANLLLAFICARTGRNSLAISGLQGLLERQPNSFEAHVALSTVLFSEGRHAEAIERGEQAIALQPDDIEAYLHLSRDLVRHGLVTEALPYLEQAVGKFPANALAHRDFALALSQLGRTRLAILAWEKVVELAPNVPSGWVQLGRLRLAAGNFSGAIECGREAVRLTPNSADARILLALALSESGGATEAEEHLLRVIELQPQEFLAHAALGLALQEQGRFDEARIHLQRTIKLSPTNGQAYFSLVRSRRTTDDDRSLLQKIESVVDHPQASLLDRSYMHYALGKANEDLKEYEAAMGHYDLATSLAAKVWFGERPPDHGWYRSMIDGTIQAFTAERLRELQTKADPSEKPLLVVGMMRSGTTLVEQIISSHSEVAAGGELTFWHDNIAKVFDPLTAKIDDLGLAAVGREYLSLLNQIGPDAARVTDKLPHNYVMIGFVLAAFPNARVVHVRRNPIDNCLSIYTTAFNRPPEFALNRENIVFAYREYERIMAHWRSILPPDRFLEVSYESLIARREDETRRMIEFAGLPWEDACLRHEKNERNVNTPSVWQVRQPIYNTSVERWRRFEPWLKEFAELAEPTISE